MGGQDHPTGLVKPDDPDAKVKFLAAEALRGVGGLVFDANGKRFANELGRRDYVTGEMWKNKPPFRLCLNKAASDEIIWHCKHYTGRGVMKYYASGADLAKDEHSSADLGGYPPAALRGLAEGCQGSRGRFLARLPIRKVLGSRQWSYRQRQEVLPQCHSRIPG